MNDAWVKIATFQNREIISVRKGSNILERKAIEIKQSINEKWYIMRYFKDLCVITHKKLIPTGARKQGTKIKHLKDNELLEGELAACMFKLDGYEIRSAARIYTDKNPVYFSLKDNSPATKEQIKQTKQIKQQVLLGLGSGYYGFRHVHEISARYIGHSDKTAFTPLAVAVEGFTWLESIVFIGTARTKKPLKTNNTILFIKKRWVGSSFGADKWYAMYPNGRISKYERHDMNTDDNIYWKI